MGVFNQCSSQENTFPERQSSGPFSAPPTITGPAHSGLLRVPLATLCCVLSQVDSLRPYGLWPTRLLCSWDFPGKNTGVGCHLLLQENLPNPGIKPVCPVFLALTLTTEPPGKPYQNSESEMKSLSCVRLFATPWTVACQAPWSMGFSRQEYWSAAISFSRGSE